MDLTDLVVHAGVVKDALGGGRLARVNMGHDADVAGLFEWHSLCHSLVPLKGWGLCGCQQIAGVFAETHHDRASARPNLKSTVLEFWLRDTKRLQASY